MDKTTTSVELVLPSFYCQYFGTPHEFSLSFVAGTLLLIGAPRRWLAVLAVLLIAVGVGVGVPLALRSGSDASTSLQERLELATRLLHEVPLIDGCVSHYHTKQIRTQPHGLVIRASELSRAFTLRFLVRLVVQPPKLDPISDREWACWFVGNPVIRLGTSRGTIQGPTSDWRCSGSENGGVESKLSSVSVPHDLFSVTFSSF